MSDQNDNPEGWPEDYDFYYPHTPMTAEQRERVWKDLLEPQAAWDGEAFRRAGEAHAKRVNEAAWEAFMGAGK